MKTWIGKHRGTLDEINKWLSFLGKKEANFTHVEETISLEFMAAPDVHEIVVRLSGPHFPLEPVQ